MIEQHYGHLAPHSAANALAIVAGGFNQQSSLELKELINE